MEDWGGYPNAATARYKERERLRKELERRCAGTKVSWHGGLGC
jgi:hypothetical protein